MNEEILNTRTILTKEVVLSANSSYYREYNGIQLPVSKTGDCWIKVSTNTLNYTLGTIENIEIFSTKLSLAGVDSLIDLINSKYPRCVKDSDGNYIGYNENTTVREVLNGFVHDNEDGTEYVKTGIYNHYFENGNEGIIRNYPTSDIEFYLFMFLIQLSGFEIVVNDTVFLDKQFIE